MQLTDEFLKDFSDEHLVYEINSLYSLLAIKIEPKDAWWVSIQNAVLESMTIHARVLYEFLYVDNQKRTDDCSAAHFFENSSIWPSRRIKPSNELIRVGTRVGKEIVHLTYSRKSDPFEKAWNLRDTTAEILLNLKLFVKYGDPKKIGGNVGPAIEHWSKLSGLNNVLKKLKI